jgi:hypothetical protein
VLIEFEFFSSNFNFNKNVPFINLKKINIYKYIFLSQLGFQTSSNAQQLVIIHLLIKKIIYFNELQG